MNDAAVGHQCPECVAEGRRTQRPVRTAFGGSAAGRHGYVTRALIGLNILAALIGVLLFGSAVLFDGGLFTGVTGWQAFGGVSAGPWTVTPAGEVAPGDFAAYGTVYPGVYDGGFFRLLTAMFIHYGVLHLAMNMWVLWVLGRDLERALGPVRFLGLYLLAGFGGNVAALLLAPQGPAAGASTSIFGLFAALFILLRRLGRDTSAVIPVLIINIVITFTVPGISWQGHLGGLVTGAVVALVLAYAPKERRTLLQAAGCGLVLAALVGLTLLGATAG
jgi:membrane associated rhomboid family serine protease